MSFFTTSLLSYGIIAALGVGYVLGYKKKRGESDGLQQDYVEINSILNHAFDGFLVLKKNGKKNSVFYSKRLGLLLNLKEKTNALSQVLNVFEPESAKKLKEHLDVLQKEGKGFDITLQHTAQNFFLQAKGVPVQVSKDEKMDLIWFKDVSDSYQKNLALRQENIAFHQQNSYLKQAFELLPHPVCIHNEKGDVIFYNSAYTEKTDENLKINWQTFSLDDDLIFKVGYDVSDYEEALNSLSEGKRSMQQVFSSLNSAVGIFDAAANLTFFNKAFCEIWKIEAIWLKKHPFFEDFLDKICENNLFPESFEINLFKKNHKELFSQLTNVFEEFLLLREGQILRCVFVPFIKGSILVLTERKI